MPKFEYHGNIVDFLYMELSLKIKERKGEAQQVQIMISLTCVYCPHAAKHRSEKGLKNQQLAAIESSMICMTIILSSCHATPDRSHQKHWATKHKGETTLIKFVACYIFIIYIVLLFDMTACVKTIDLRSTGLRNILAKKRH